MRTKLTAAIVACALLAAGIAASLHAAPISVAVYAFSTQDDVSAFHKVFGSACKRKWQANQMLAIRVREKTNSCIFRSSVVADSSDPKPDLGMVATTGVTGGSKKLARKAFVGVGVRQSDSAGYFLRVLPNQAKWQFLRDPEGGAGPKVEASGAGKFVKARAKPNVISIRAFSRGGPTTSVIATVNGRTVVNTTDSGPDQPAGRRTVVLTGAKGSGAATGISGLFDNVNVQVPNPF
jgi:hypothetical protein